MNETNRNTTRQTILEAIFYNPSIKRVQLTIERDGKTITGGFDIWHFRNDLPHFDDWRYDNEYEWHPEKYARLYASGLDETKSTSRADINAFFKGGRKFHYDDIVSIKHRNKVIYTRA